ncbi:hypothetical protein AAF712_016393, partial [Marasmius tenuissimus]
EGIAKHITYQMCDALSYIHNKGVTHRDIKPENVLLTSSSPPQVKITDFGLSVVSDKLTMLTTICGTPAYLAPEMIRRTPNQGYDNLVDSWSTGVVVFNMLTRASPFLEGDHPQGLHVWLCGRTIDWQVFEDAAIPVGCECRKFIERLVEEDPQKRMDMREALSHPWLIEDIES